MNKKTITTATLHRTLLALPSCPLRRGTVHSYFCGSEGRNVVHRAIPVQMIADASEDADADPSHAGMGRPAGTTA